MSAGAKAAVRMSAQTISTPSSARRARATSRAWISMPRTRDAHRRLGPAARPSALLRGLRSGREQAREQALAAADVEHARARRDDAARDQVAEDRIEAQLAAREVPGEASGAPVGRARRLHQRAPGGRRVGARASRAAGAPSRAAGSVTVTRRAFAGAAEQLRQDLEQHGRGRSRCCAALPSWASRMSPAASLPASRAEHRLGLAPHGVEGAPRPADELQLEPLQHRREERIAQPGRGAEEARRDAGDVGQRRLRGGDLARGRTGAEQREGVRVAIAVVLHAVAAPHDLAAQGRVRAGALGDAEEGGTRAVQVEQIEHRRRDRRVGAVVDRQRDLAPGDRRRGQARPVAAEPLRTRPAARRR